MAVDRNDRGASGRGAFLGAGIGGMVALAVTAYAVARGIATTDDLKAMAATLRAEHAAIDMKILERIANERRLTDLQIKQLDREQEHCERDVDALRERCGLPAKKEK